MDLNAYVVGTLTEQRLEELRATATRHRLARAVDPRRGTLRVAIGEALIRLGALVRGETCRARVSVASPAPQR